MKDLIRGTVRARRTGIAVALALCALAGVGCGGGAKPAAAGRPQFDKTRAFADLEAQVNMGPRAPGTAAHAQIVNWLKTHLAQYADRVTEQTFRSATALSAGVEYDFTNIIAEFNPGAQGDSLVLAAHFDTRPIADHDPNPANRDKPIPGANDGGSGVAILLEIARALKAQPPSLPVVLLFFDAEDSGSSSAPGMYMGFCLGSQYFVAHRGAYDVDRLILLDIVGGSGMSVPRERYSKQAAPMLQDLVYSTAARLGHTAFQDRDGSPVIDDHVPFIQAGIPAIDLIDIDYPQWHTLDDTPAHCSADSLYQVGDTLLELIYVEL